MHKVYFHEDVALRSSIDRDIQLDNLHVALEELTRSVKSMVELFCRTFHTDFRFESSQNLRKGAGIFFSKVFLLRCKVTGLYNVRSVYVRYLW